VGFLFGACSACCDDDECEECTHYRFGTNCSELLNEVNVDFGEYGTLTVDKFNCGTLTPEEGRDDCVRDSPNQDAFSASFDLFESSIADLPEPFLPACSQDEFNRPWLGEPIKFFAEAAVNTPAEIVAGCGTKQAQVIVRVSDTGLNDFRIVGVATVNTNNCTGGVIENVPVVFEIDELADLADFPDCAAAYLAFFNNLGVTVTVDYKPCACNKCTHFYNQSSLAEHGSYTVNLVSELLGNATRTREQIAETDLNADNPLIDEADAQELDGFPACVIDRNPFPLPLRIWELLELSLVQDDCGCESVVLDISLSGLFQFEDGSDIPIGTAIQRINVNSCEGDSFELEFPAFELTENAFLQSVGEDCASEIAAWLNENISGSISVTVNPCDCGACCDEGCEDNVAEGGCENWAGVGTSCCDDPDPCAEE
jgi:hypothetical protein